MIKYSQNPKLKLGFVYKDDVPPAGFSDVKETQEQTKVNNDLGNPLGDNPKDDDENGTD